MIDVQFLFRDFLDAEVALLGALVNTPGFRVKPQDAIRDASYALATEQVIRSVVEEELRRRELDVLRTATVLIEKVLNRL